jgi:tetratricopeptide (TPR) repeat protein
MAAKVFISYRREDSAAYAGRIQDRLEREFERDLLFIDVDGIPLGLNFVKVLREEVANCGVLLAAIGRDWLDVRDKDGTRRLDNPTDFVRIEIATALQREIPVIPILLDGTSVPTADQLPEDLKELALRNGLDVRHASFHADMDKLIRELKGHVGAPRALFDKGIELGKLGRRVQAIAVYDDLLARFSNELPREYVAAALRNKGIELGKLGSSVQAIAVYDDLLARFGNATELPLREHVAAALRNKGAELGKLGRVRRRLRGLSDSLLNEQERNDRDFALQLECREQAIAVYDDLLARFGNATELPLREHVAAAFCDKGDELFNLGRSEQAIAVYDDLLARFGDATELPLREHVATARSAKEFIAALIEGRLYGQPAGRG